MGGKKFGIRDRRRDLSINGAVLYSTFLCKYPMLARDVQDEYY